jgi:hypothetical protein
MNKKQLALDTIPDVVANYLYYDRKNDDELSKEDMKYLIESRILTEAEIITVFTDSLRQHLSENFELNA